MKLQPKCECGKYETTCRKALSRHRAKEGCKVKKGRKAIHKDRAERNHKYYLTVKEKRKTSYKQKRMQ